LGRPGERRLADLPDGIELAQEGEVAGVAEVVALLGQETRTQRESVGVLRAQREPTVRVGQRGGGVGLLEEQAAFEQRRERVAERERVVAGFESGGLPPRDAL